MQTSGLPLRSRGAIGQALRTRPKVFGHLRFLTRALSWGLWYHFGLGGVGGLVGSAGLVGEGRLVGSGLDFP